MEIIDPKFRKNKAKYVAQTSLVVMVIFIILTVLDAVSNAAVIASLGASSFIAFTMPHADVSRPRFMLGGYAVSIVVGTSFFYASVLVEGSSISLVQSIPIEVFAAFALGVAIFIMVTANFEHPPAAGVALGLVLNGSTGLTILVLMVGILSLVLAKVIAKPVLINLL